MPELVRLAGGEEVWGAEGAYSTGKEFNALTACNADVMLLMPCGFSVARTVEEGARVLPGSVPGWAGLAAVAAGRVWAVHGNRLFSGAGPDLVEGLELLVTLLHGTEAERGALAAEDAARFTA